jgi:hypothetical protein
MGRRIPFEVKNKTILLGFLGSFPQCTCCSNDLFLRLAESRMKDGVLYSLGPSRNLVHLHLAPSR